ncbi:hypothetical protein SAMN05192588_1411 [Nonlabens sp. Hel1_33_55]|uniref:hypothetical protein n=1 Tax=Nonlabens sp. Hel1_33_55 TaxID=1336802 RepID=UPI000875BEEB|nr:hypothetical protein [Nonlabens sp. Hel1_33_55]SCY15421.1 hypothetical protein SAMN05192588_1411 [Nonlabens sp. Hel1_33_55]
MKLFGTSQTTKICLVVFMVFAFVKANSQTDSASIINTSYTFTKNDSREQLFKTINDIRADHQVEVKLIAYSRRENQVKELGIALRPENGEWMEFNAVKEQGIKSVCINLIDGAVNYIKSCDDKEIITPRSPVLRQDVVTSQEVVKAADKTKTRQEQLDSLKAGAVAAKEERLSLNQQQDLERKELQNDQLAGIKNDLIIDTDSIKREKALRKAELRKLQIEVNRSTRERQSLAYNNKRERAKRDSLQDQQLRLQEKLDSQQRLLQETLAQQIINDELIKKQQQIIEEQGLKSETAESLKAYRKAMLGENDGHDFKSQGYLLFAMEQCLYKVYEGYTIVYGNQGNFLFTINKELNTSPMVGTLNINGDTFDYSFSGDVLSIKNANGDLVNQDGAPLATLNKY